MKKLITFLLAIILFSCQSTKQTKPIGESPLILDEFDFETKIATLYPDKYKSKDFSYVYDIPSTYHSNFVEKDTIFENEFDESKKAIGFEYRQKSSTSIDTLALLNNQPFQKVNVATTLDNKIKIISAVADEIPKSKSDKIIKYLTENYGPYKKIKAEFGTEFYIYEWKTQNKTYRYSPILDNESSTIKLVINDTKGTIKSGKKEPHINGYFYIIQNNFIKDIEKLKTGDFVFCQ